jgi:nucleotide-binding universal stress UspA family protein
VAETLISTGLQRFFSIDFYGRSHKPMGGNAMYRRILLAYDGSDYGQKTLLECCELAQWSQCEVHLLAVRPRDLAAFATEAHQYHATVTEGEIAHYRSILESGIARLSQFGLRARSTIVTGDPVREIANHAKKIAADLIVVGHRHSDEWTLRWWKGSTSVELIELCACSVLIVVT